MMQVLALTRADLQRQRLQTNDTNTVDPIIQALQLDAFFPIKDVKTFKDFDGKLANNPNIQNKIVSIHNFYEFLLISLTMK